MAATLSTSVTASCCIRLRSDFWRTTTPAIWSSDAPESSSFQIIFDTIEVTSLSVRSNVEDRNEVEMVE